MAYIPDSGSVAAWIQSDNASVITVSQSSIATVIVGGSIAALVTPPANQSVSGTVKTQAVSTNASIITVSNDSSVLSVPVGSTIGVIQGSVAAVIIGGSIAATFTPPANQSVSGTVGASIIGLAPVSVSNFPTTQNVNGSVVAFQGGAPWANTNVGSVITIEQGSIAAVIIGGSVATVTTNSSVMLLTGTNMVGSVAAYQGSIPWTINSVYGNISGSVAATITNTNVNVSGSVVAFQGAGWSGSILAVPTGNQSVSGTLITAPGADTIPAQSSILVGVTANTNGSVVTTTGYQMAMLQITSGPGASITGAINFEGTADGTQFVPIQGYNPTTQAISSMATIESDWAFNVAGLQGMRARVSNWTVGSITARVNLSPEDARPFATYNSGGQTSVSGTVGASIVGQLPAGVAMLGSVVAYQGVIPWTISSVYGNISGSVAATVTNTVTVVSSIAGGIFPISGSVAATIVGTPNVNTAGSVVAFQGTSPWVVNSQNSSILAVPVGSVITLNQGSSILAVPVGSTIAVLQAPSIVGTYAEDAASANADKGVFVLGVRNDTLTSVTSADGDYGAFTIGPMGEVVTANSPITKWVYGTTSIVSGPSVALIAAQGASIFTYVTGLQVANFSANNLTGNLSTGAGAASVLLYWVAPANGGSNMVFPNPLRSRDNTAILASISGVGSVYLSAQGFIAKT